ncbi:MAG: alpha/beta hydrolase, partial [Cyclobacteriaceae bacterium]|nr:alpha/beta hydrolase [Cyclobacteriaceae bacterium]
MKLYCISGLGADHRIFANLQLNNVSVRHIHWEEPLPNHNLSDYAKTLLSQISDPEPILLGVSFGGLIAIEMTRWIKPLKIFLVSSIKTRNEMPSLY